MRVPYNWLAEFVDLQDCKPETLMNELSLKAFEVEDLEMIGANLEGPLLAGKICEISKHPDADKLQVTKVQLNSHKPEELKQIVCGANNIAVGQIVPVALPGATVINRKTAEALAIKESKIRGVFSEGMLCSASELGQESDFEGILILSPETELGQNLIKPRAVVLNIASRSNRGDALCLQGIAREAAACLGKNLKIDFYSQDFQVKFKQLTQTLPSLKAEIHASEACKQIVFLQIDNVKVKQSPAWLQEKLKLAGISSINNVVDIGNYVMLETGQPMHIYDANKLDLNESLNVRYAEAGEKLQALNDQCYDLQKTNLLIAQKNEVLALAGLMGGLASSVQSQTQNLLLEFACFKPSVIRHSSRASGLASESSRRFERGTDPALIQIALNQAVDLIQQLAGGKLSAFAGAFSTEHSQPPILNLALNLDNYQKIMGQGIEASEAIKTLNLLGFTSQLQAANSLSVQVPSYRQADITREIDLIEELARLQGLNNLPFIPLPKIKQQIPEPESTAAFKQSLLSQGYTEIISSSLVPQQPDQKDIINMKNPLSQDHASLRASLVPGLLKTANLNFRRGQSEIRFFEIGKIYHAPPVSAVQSLNEKETGSQETAKLAILLASKQQSSNWQGRVLGSADFYELKGLLEILLKSKGNLVFQKPAEAELPALAHPGICAVLKFNGRELGYVQQIHPLVAQSYDLPANTLVSELLLEPLLKKQSFKPIQLNDQPILYRDFTIDFAPEAELVEHQQITNLVQKNKLEHLQNIKLLDLYRQNGHTSLTYRLVFQAPAQERLDGEKISSQIELLKDQMQKQFSQASFRI
jgi:phenylalanyl-tRNA synthetase beta chain